MGATGRWVVALAVVASVSSCARGSDDPAARPPFTGLPAVASPLAGTVDVIGDGPASQAAQATDWEAMFPPGSDLSVDVRPGAKVEDFLRQLTLDVGNPVTPRPDVLVVSVGTTNGLGPTSYGWSDLDADLFSKLLAVPDGSSCVVVVLPGVGPQASPTEQTNAAVMRASMLATAEARPHTVVADWGDWAAQHPEDLDVDGIALNGRGAQGGYGAGPQAAESWRAVVRDGIEACTDA